MGFIENLRQWTSEQADKLTDQDNVYHRSSGKTQKEYKQDLNFYDRLEDAMVKSAIGLGALDAGAMGVMFGGPALGASYAGQGWLWPLLGIAAEKQNEDEQKSKRRRIDQ